jgi:hypothetical protein
MPTVDFVVVPRGRNAKKKRKQENRIQLEGEGHQEKWKGE